MPGSNVWASDVVLADGETVHIRPIRTDDATALGAFHRRQPAEDNYRRYFTPKPELSESELEHFTDVDMYDRVAFVVEERGELIGWASYERWPGRDDADAAFQVDHEHQGRGIATLLLEHLAAIARSNGVTRFTAEVLANNRPMLTVFSRAGWPVQRRFESGIVDLDWPLADTSEFLDSVERREQRADSRAVARLLMPRTIAVVGASDRAGSVGASVFTQVMAGASGPVYPINPAHDQVGGVTAYPSVTAVPDDIHLAIVVVPAAALVATLDDCIAARVRGAVVITSVEGLELDVGELVSRARRHGLRLIGPGSMGVASSQPEIGLHAALVPVWLMPGSVAISMQGGPLGASLLRLASQLGMGVSWFVSLGDKCDISGNDLLQFWEDDDHTRVVAMYTEAFGNPRKFARIARRVSRSRPIVAVRTGTAAVDPTGSALYQQAGLIEVPTVRMLLDVARVLATQPVPEGPNVAVLSNSASPAALASAALATAGLTAVVGDPLDYRADAAAFGRAVRAALARDDVHAVLVIHAPPVADALTAPLAEIDEAAGAATKPVLAVLLGADDGPLRPGSPVPAFAFPEPAAAVLGRAYAYRRWLSSEAAAEPEPVADIDPARAAGILADALEQRRDELSVTEAAALIGSYGIPTPPTRVVPAPAALAAAEEIGFPVAVKAMRRHVGRSLEAGVGLDLAHGEDVVTAVQAMRRSLGDDAAEVIVQKMTPPGLDLRIRATADERLGAVIAIGLGGRNTDLIADEATRLTPLSTPAARSLIERSRAGPALEAAGIAADAITDVLMRTAQLVTDRPEIVELDLNPVLVAADASWVTDAVVRIAPDHGDHGALRRLG
jgi:acyl-CoA synthetase (NDP forming)/GNAT superfamily N-acetyltransferase